MMMTSKIRMALAAIIWLGGASSTYAGFVTFDIEWAGAVGSSVSATGFITFDDAYLPADRDTGPAVVFLPSSWVSNLGITVTGASTGNGTFGLGDFGAIAFYTPSDLDLSTELIGQALTSGSGCTFGGDLSCGTAGDIGEFNLLSAVSGSNAPEGINFFALRTAEGSGDVLVVTSMKPRQVPEPATLALFGLGLAGIPFVRRRRTPA